jgi:hypothetical protein
MKRVRKSLLIGAVSYGALWGLTFAFGGRLLERHLAADLQKDWRSWRQEVAARQDRFPGTLDRMASPGGPSLKVGVISCPAPFYLAAKVDRSIGESNAQRFEGRYLVFPWGAYLLSDDRIFLKSLTRR